MTLTINMITEAADLLSGAHHDRAPVGQLTERYSEMDVADAYAIQQVNLHKSRPRAVSQ